MRQYKIKYEMINPRSKEVFKYSTTLYNSEKETMDEYLIEANKRAQMGILDIVVAVLFEYRELSTNPLRETKIVDWRTDKKRTRTTGNNDDILRQTIIDRNRTVNMIISSIKSKVIELEDIWSVEDMSIMTVHNDDTRQISEEMLEDINFLFRTLG